MTKVALTVAMCATLLWAGTARAVPTAQQNCDYARIKAWKVYTSCIDAVVAKDAQGVSRETGYVRRTDRSAAFSRCRHAYFESWTAFQPKASLAGSTCIGARYTDNGDQTVTDNLSGLTWEKKDNAGGIHDKDNLYTWSTGSPSTGTLSKEDGTAFTTFLATVNGDGGFAGANGWRLPTLAELQTIVLDFACNGHFGGAGCTCPTAGPCVDPALDASNTQSGGTFLYGYWSATSSVPALDFAWVVIFGDGSVDNYYKPGDNYVRAVRGGL